VVVEEGERRAEGGEETLAKRGGGDAVARFCAIK
jgi:hypothetical protein